MSRIEEGVRLTETDEGDRAVLEAMTSYQRYIEIAQVALPRQDESERAFPAFFAPLPALNSLLRAQ